MSPARLAFRTRSSEETLALASALGGLLEGGEVIALQGELGSGKTTFTKGLCHGLGLADTRGVSSPTYVLEHVYPARFPVRHYDAYRLGSSEEFVALGFEEHLGTGAILVVEWADKVAEVLPPERLWVHMGWGEPGPEENGRRVSLAGVPGRWSSRLERLRALRGAAVSEVSGRTTS